MQRGLVFNIQRYSLHDGPGIRSTVFLKGCPLCCEWCHNPEGISPRPQILRIENRCIACGECRCACPFGESIPQGAGLPASMESCTACGACVDACPTGARQWAGREMTVAEVMAELLRDRIFYEESAGGVTFSGGEPLTQPHFLLGLLEACRVQGLHTAVDTCGFGCTDHLLAAARLARLILYDLKLMDETRHQQHTGVSNRPILENLKQLDRLNVPLWIRVPLIPGVNDDEASLNALAQFVSTLRSVQQVNLLPYHRTGLQKARRLDRGTVMPDVVSPDSAQLNRAVELLRRSGLPVRSGG